MIRWLGVAWPFTLLAQSPVRPTVGPLDTARTVVARDTALANGVRVTLAHLGRSPKALVRIVLSTGAERPAGCGLSAIVAHTFDAGSLGDSVVHMGGQLAASVKPERVELDADVLSEFAGTTLELLGHIVREPRLAEASTLATAADTPGNADTAGMWALSRALYPEGEFHADCPSSAGVSAYGVADIADYYQSRVGPWSTRIVVVGQFDNGSVLRAAERTFGDWRNDSQRSDTGHNAPAVAAPGLIFVHRAGAKQSAILVGARVPGPADSDHGALRVADAVLGANVVSRISMNIREAKGYAYAPGSVIVTAPSGVAYWVELADVSTSVTWPALREILAEIARLGGAAPDTAEVEGGKRYLIGRTLVETATRSGWADGDRASPVGDRTRTITAADIRRVVAAYLAADRLTIVVVGDTNALGDQRLRIREAAEHLRNGLGRLEPRTGGRLGVYAIGARDSTAAYRADERFPLLSTFKLPLVVATLARVDRGEEHLARRIPVTWADTVGHSPIVVQRLAGGDHDLPVRDLCMAAMRYSDNAAANLLLAQIGGPAGLTAWMRTQGDAVFRLDGVEPALNERPASDARDTSTPHAMAAFLDRVVHGELLSESSRALVLDWMRTNTTGDDRLRAGAPPGWTVGDKTGSAPHRSNDIGVLTAPDGRVVIVAVYVTETTADDSLVNGVIADIARGVTR